MRDTNTNVSEEGGGGDAPGTRADSPAAYGEDYGEADYPSPAHGG